jgi:hypothetical protein
MTHLYSRTARLIASALVLISTLSATTLAKLSFEELTDNSEVVVSGTVTRSWTAWDAEHQYIWTHYEMAVENTVKGSASRTLEFAEPGGVVAGTGMNIVGSVVYQTGENVMIFLARQPNGYLRTTGWGQGKYTIDADRRLHGDASLKQVDLVANPAGPAVAVSSIRTLDGMSLAEAAQRVAVRARQHSQGGGR